MPSNGACILMGRTAADFGRIQNFGLSRFRTLDSMALRGRSDGSSSELWLNFVPEL